MEGELKKIKKIYGEDFAKLCRTLFPSILEEEGKLLQILTENFAPSHSIYESLVSLQETHDFKCFIMHKSGRVNNEPKYIKETPEELLAKKGYKLYRCTTDADVKSFVDYYTFTEALCTFYDPRRIENFDIFFAVHENAKKLDRQAFRVPRREDEYGVSVMSFQFDKEDGSLSIKNRYNHAVINPDCTYENDLDNIVPGLTDSFATHYGLHEKLNYADYAGFTLTGFVQGNDGKSYKENLRISGKSFCENNVVIEDGVVTQYSKERYELIDQFLLDKSTKTLVSLSAVDDSFVEMFNDVKKIGIEKLADGMRQMLVTKTDGTEFIVLLDKTNSIIGYANEHQTEIADGFLSHATRLEELYLPNVTTIGNSFLAYNEELKRVKLPKVTHIGTDFLMDNRYVNYVSFPNLVEAGNYFMHQNRGLKSVEFPKLEIVGNRFLSNNYDLNSISMPSLVVAGGQFLYGNGKLQEIDFPKLQRVGTGFLRQNNDVTDVNLPELEFAGAGFMNGNKKLETLVLPKLVVAGDGFLSDNLMISSVKLPNLRVVGDDFLMENYDLTEISLPKVESIGSNFLALNSIIQEIDLPEVKQIGDKFLECNEVLEGICLPSLEEIGDLALCENKRLFSAAFPKVKRIGKKMLEKNDSLKFVDVPAGIDLPLSLERFVNKNSSNAKQ